MCNFLILFRWLRTLGSKCVMLRTAQIVSPSAHNFRPRAQDKVESTSLARFQKFQANSSTLKLVYISRIIYTFLAHVNI